MSPEGSKFKPGTGLAKFLVEIPTQSVRFYILLGLAHNGLSFSHLAKF